MENPWSQPFEEFQLFCCPECEIKCKESVDLLRHALDTHKKAQEFFGLDTSRPRPAKKPEKSVNIGEIVQTLQIPLNVEIVENSQKLSTDNVAKLLNAENVENIQIPLNVEIVENSQQQNPVAKLQSVENVDFIVENVEDMENVEFKVESVENPQQQNTDNGTTFQSVENVDFSVENVDDMDNVEDMDITEFKVESGENENFLENITIAESLKNEEIMKDDDSQVQCYYCCALVAKDWIKMHTKAFHGDEIPQKFGPQLSFQCTNCKAALDSFDHTCEPVPQLMKPVSKFRKYEKIPDDVSHIFPQTEFYPQSNKQILDHVKTFVDNIVKQTIPPKEPVVKKPAKRNIEVLKCEKCDQEFTVEKNYVMHMLSVHDQTHNFPCPQCELVLKTLQSRRKHVRRIHEKERNHVCENCGQKYFNAYNLRDHKKSCLFGEHQNRSTQNINCDICGTSVLGLKALEVHKNISHGIEMPKNPLKMWTECGICGKSFNNKKLHNSMYHSSSYLLNSVDSSCDNCGRNCGNSLRLNSHVEKCSNNLKNFTCEMCKIGNWVSTKSLAKHAAEEHRMLVKVCDICGKFLANKEKMLRHRKSHEENHQCKFCDKTFALRSTLNRHIAEVHDRSKLRFKCEKCDYGCWNSRKLIQHNNAVHDKSVTFNCHLCNYVGYTSDNLREHIKMVHNKHKRFKCQYCDQGFPDRKGYTKHLEYCH